MYTWIHVYMYSCPHVYVLCNDCSELLFLPSYSLNHLGPDKILLPPKGSCTCHARFHGKIRPQCKPRWRFSRWTARPDLVMRKAWEVPLQHNSCLWVPSVQLQLRWKVEMDDASWYNWSLAVKRENSIETPYVFLFLPQVFGWRFVYAQSVHFTWLVLYIG